MVWSSLQYITHYGDIETLFSRDAMPGPTQPPSEEKRLQHRINLLHHGILLPDTEKADSDPTSTMPCLDSSEGSIEIDGSERTATQIDDETLSRFTTGRLTVEQTTFYLNRLSKLLSKKTHITSSPSNMEMESRVDGEYFVWTKNEYFISGQKSQRVAVQVTIRTRDDLEGFKCKATLMAAKPVVKPLRSSLVLLPDFHITTKSSVNQQLCFSQYLFKKEKKHMKLDIWIPAERSQEISQFVRCRPAIKALDFVRAPLGYQPWLVPTRELHQNKCLLQCTLYFLEWDFFDRFCDRRYRLSLMKRRLNLIIQVEHFLADVTYTNVVADPRTQNKKKKFQVKLKVKKEIFTPLLELFDITLVSRHSQEVINDVVRGLGLDRDNFLDDFHRRFFTSIPRTSEGFFSFAQFFEFYHYRRRRNSVLAIADPSQFVEAERDFIFPRTTPGLNTKLAKVVEEFFSSVSKIEDAKATSLTDIVLRLRSQWGLRN